ncbi:threonine ammonia-lyase [Methylobacterium nonmethylotrophicum]|uniref:Threonine ammonia-lyase n=1 Tax=Methylobacterium nonmethylotrophicum TaxID=1141884 RepID=A0A4Z0NS88_9HYPH|nr:threonine ammonia-lyase [Methylobacterium nonmethylotrophicum]TGE00113.1 threonine ammonia-lyase [Methylobacterium nonmethylotrophicum]
MSQPYAITPDDVVRASRTIRGHVLRTPLVQAPRLSELTGARVLVKHENMQATGAFKERGAINRLSALSEAESRRGVVAMSAGNHAQAVAYHAKRLDIPATIVMPATTPLVKVENTRAHGATVVLEGETLVEAAAAVERLVEAHGYVLVHPYDDPLVMAGQGTIALEMLEDAPDLDCLVVPIGGGGLMSGIAVAASPEPQVALYGVEAALYPSFLNAIDGQDRPIGGPTLAEGIAVKTVGRLTLPIIRDLVREIVLVDEPQIERAVHDYATLQRSLAEGAGAAGLAALLARPDLFSGRTVGLVLCGGNIDARLLASVMVRELEREDRIISFRMTASDRPGVLGRVAGRLGELGANILEVSHGRLHLDVPAKSVSIDVTIETRGPGHTAEILDTLCREGLMPRRIGPHGTAATGG